MLKEILQMSLLSLFRYRYTALSDEYCTAVIFFVRVLVFNWLTFKGFPFRSSKSHNPDVDRGAGDICNA